MVKTAEKFTIPNQLHIFPLTEKQKRYEDKLAAVLKESKQYEKYYQKKTISKARRVELAISHAFLEVIIPHSHSTIDREMFFEILKEESSKPEYEELELREGKYVRKYPYHVIPLSTKEAFRKFIQRAKLKGIPKSLINGNLEKKGKGCKWTEITKFIVVLFAVKKTTHTSSREIFQDLQNLIEDHPDIVAKGVTLVKPSTIRLFLKKQGKAYISFAKDNANEFKRKITGTLRFFPPSALLVKVGIDAYHFQVFCADDETLKPITFIAEVILDFRAKAVLAAAFGKTESNITFRKAWREYFQRMGNKIPRQIAMDKFSSHTCEKVEELNTLFEKKLVDISRSSNANNNSPLERFFRTTQEYQSSVLEVCFIGYGIQSKGSNTRPAKNVIIKLRKKDFLKSESEMQHLLRYILFEVYNKTHKVRKDQTPTDLLLEESNHIDVATDEEVAAATWEKHYNMIVGCGVFIKSGDYLYLYKKRTLQIATKYYRHKVIAYINPDNPTEDAVIYCRESNVFLFRLKHLAIVPCAIFDRTEEQKQFVRNYNKETRELIAAIERELQIMETNVEELLDGQNFLESRTAAKIKRAADAAFTQTQIGLQEPKPEPSAMYANTLAPFKKSSKIKKTAEQELMEKYGLMK